MYMTSSLASTEMPRRENREAKPSRRIALRAATFDPHARLHRAAPRRPAEM